MTKLLFLLQVKFTCQVSWTLWSAKLIITRPWPLSLSNWLLVTERKTIARHRRESRFRILTSHTLLPVTCIISRSQDLMLARDILSCSMISLREDTLSPSVFIETQKWISRHTKINQPTTRHSRSPSLLQVKMDLTKRMKSSRPSITL